MQVLPGWQMAVTIEPNEAMLRVEISRNFRRRMPGVYLAAALATLFFVLAAFSFDMMHEDGAVPVDATIIAVESDAESGETWMTSEFVDKQGVVRHDRQTAGYHYARGEPKVGERIEYIYRFKLITGDFYATPRVDRILQWIFGIPALLCVAMAGLAIWFLLRQRSFRRRMLVSGRREPGTAYVVIEKTVTLPGAGNRMQQVRMWRLQARYFEATLSGFRDCHSDWWPAPAPEFGDDSPVSPILLDPANPKRYWLPLGPLLKPTS